MECVNIRFSKDYGKTWSKENTCLDGSPVKGMPCSNPDNSLHPTMAVPGAKR